MPARIDFGHREIVIAVPLPSVEADLRVTLHRELDTALDALLMHDAKPPEPEGPGRIADEGGDP